MSWITKVEVKKILETSKTDHDDLIDALIPYCEQQFKSLSNYTPDSAERTEKIPVNNTKIANLHFYPVTAVNYVKFVYNSTSITFDTDEYNIFAEGRIEFNAKIGAGYVEIKYTGGNSTIPEDITNGVIMQVIDWMNKRDRLGLKSKGKAGESTSYSDLPLLPSFIQLCKSYENFIPNRQVV